MTAVCACLLLVSASPASAQQPAPARKPNIVVIFGDDIGVWNLSAYHRGMMGGKTPNLDKLAQQGAMSRTIIRRIPARRVPRRFSPGKPRYAPAC
jgi:arylsulfatase